MIRVSNIELETGADTCELRAHVETKDFDKPFTLWYRLPLSAAPFVSAKSGDPFLAALLLPAMSMGEFLEVEAPVSPKLLRSVDQIQDIFACWFSGLSKVPVRAPRRDPDALNGRAHRLNGLFFSLGADSFYSFLKNQSLPPADEETIGALVVVHGFDIPVGKRDNRLFPQLLAGCQRVATEHDKEVLPVATNLREITDLYVPWGDVGHGAALASVGLALEGIFREIRISAAFSYSHLHPNGSHALTDPLWSTEHLSFVHDGGEASRLDKFRLIAQFPIALETLRVCYSSKDALNCGRCGKCLRSMIALHVAGGLRRCRTLPSTIDVERVRQLTIDTDHQDIIMTELAHALSHSEEDRALEAALRECLQRGRVNRVSKDAKLSIDLVWTQRAHRTMRDIEAVIPESESMILADDEQCRHFFGKVRNITPFLEQGGQYNGPPPDDDTAISELERLRQAGANFIAFAWPAFWWLEHYTGLHDHLQARYRRILENDRLIVFDLRV